VQQPIEVEVDDQQPIVARVAAVDVAKATGMVCTRVPHDHIAGKRVTMVWEVSATTRALVELADHLRCQGIERVILESTSDYVRGFYYIRRPDGVAGQRGPGQERPRSAEDRPVDRTTGQAFPAERAVVGGDG
jgi:transposase